MHVRPLTQEDPSLPPTTRGPRRALPPARPGHRHRGRRARRPAADRPPRTRPTRAALRGRGRRRHVVGLSLSLIREGVWGYSLFAVAERVQRPRARAARCSTPPGTTAGRERPHHPQLRAPGGHAPLRPDRAAAAAVHRGGRDRRPRRAPDLSPVRDAGGRRRPSVVDAIGRELRGAGHGVDLQVLLEVGTRLAVVEDRAFALFAGAGVILAGGRDDEERRAGAAGAPSRAWAAARRSHVDFLTAGQDWAVQTCLSAGLALSPDGPMFAGGDLGPMRAVPAERGLPLGRRPSTSSRSRRRPPRGRGG